MPELSKIVSSKDFDDWYSLNDTVMGGTSKAVCKTTSKGLSLEGIVVEEKGGFVSCKSPIYKPVLNFSGFEGFELKVLRGMEEVLKNSICPIEIELNCRTLNLSNTKLNDLLQIFEKFDEYPCEKKKS